MLMAYVIHELIVNSWLKLRYHSTVHEKTKMEGNAFLLKIQTVHITPATFDVQTDGCKIACV